MGLTPVDRTFRRSGFWILLVVLGLLILGQGLLVAGAMRLAWQLEDAQRRAAGRVAWLALLIGCVQVLLLFWVIIRHVRESFAGGRGSGSTDYVDVWATAGQRFRLEEDDDAPDAEDEPDDDEPRPGR